MFGSTGKGINAYQTVAVETGVAAASPHRLIVMLYDGAMAALTTATSQMKAGNIPAKGRAISHAIQIISSGLQASINKESGGEIAQNLDALYEYMCGRLLLANLKNQPELLEEVFGLLKGLKEAWEKIDPQPQFEARQAVPPKAASYDSLSPRVSSLAKA